MLVLLPVLWGVGKYQDWKGSETKGESVTLESAEDDDATREKEGFQWTIPGF